MSSMKTVDFTKMFKGTQIKPGVPTFVDFFDEPHMMDPSPPLQVPANTQEYVSFLSLDLSLYNESTIFFLK